MRSPRAERVAIGIIVLAAAVGIAALPRLPAEMAVHWNAAGQVDGTMPALPGVFFLPALMAGLFGLFHVLPRIDPLGENISRFRDAYEEFIVAILLFLGYLQALVLWWNLGGGIDMAQAIVPGIAGLYVFVGRLMGQARQNWFVGIRTPWTLSSEAVWNEVHRQASPLFMVAGAVALGGLVLPAYTMLFIAGPVALIALYTTVLSYWLYRQDERMDAQDLHDSE